MSIIEICDLSDERIACYTGMTDSELKNEENFSHGLFIAEGEKVIRHALENGIRPVSFLMERKHITGKAAGVIDLCPEVPVYTGESALLTKLTGFRMNRGFLCAMERPQQSNVLQVLENAKRVAVLEDLCDPTNVGAIFRSAAALGMDGILLSPKCCDPLHRRALKVSMGNAFRVSYAQIPERCEADTMDLLHAKGFQCFALALREHSISITDARMKTAQRIALFLGTEGDGLREETIRACDECVLIPMYAGADSLNVATAAAIAFWETGKKSGE